VPFEVIERSVLPISGVALGSGVEVSTAVADNVFEDSRLASVYDLLDPDRSDLDHYRAIADEVGATSALDIGCGTGILACLLAEDGLRVTGVDPAAAMLDVARSRAGADAVRWIHGTVEALPPLAVELVTMTGNVAQVFLTDEEWASTLHSVRSALLDGGTFVFETRRPERRAWEEWTRDLTYERVDVPEFGVIETWNEVTDVSPPFITFEGTIHFHRDDTVLTSTSTLRFRTRPEIDESLESAGLRVRNLREAPDRPGKELVYLAERS
jgi:SAM-dependent methyltransferase